MDGLLKELDWLGGGMDAELSEAVNDLTQKGAETMYENMAKDTHHMADTMGYNLDFMRGTIFSNTTGYALFTDGEIPITSRPYTTTPFIQPTLEAIRGGLGVFEKVVSARSA